MRTTLDVDDDVLSSAKEIAQRQHKTAGKVLSELARAGLTRGVATASGVGASAFGFAPFPSRGAVVTNEQIRQLRDQSDE